MTKMYTQEEVNKMIEVAIEKASAQVVVEANKAINEKLDTKKGVKETVVEKAAEVKEAVKEVVEVSVDMEAIKAAYNKLSNQASELHNKIMDTVKNGNVKEAMEMKEEWKALEDQKQQLVEIAPELDPDFFYTARKAASNGLHTSASVVRTTGNGLFDIVNVLTTGVLDLAYEVTKGTINLGTEISKQAVSLTADGIDKLADIVDPDAIVTIQATQVVEEGGQN